MVLEFHFNIKSCEFAKMSVGVRVLSTENWSDFEDALEVAAERHLLVELGALGETRVLLEVLQAEHVRAAL